MFLHCNAKEVVERCTRVVQGLVRKAYGPNTFIPEVIIQGNYNVTFPYILSHLEYIVGELLRNSIQATIEQRRSPDVSPPPIEVLICDTPQHVIMRISDQGGGILPEILPHLWSFSKGPRRERRLENLRRVPKMAATLQEVNVTTDDIESVPTSSPLLPLDDENTSGIRRESSLSSLTSRPPELRLGVGLPMSRIYAEYWAGSLEIHNLEGYGADAFLQIPKLGNKNEQLTTRASMDAV